MKVSSIKTEKFYTLEDVSERKLRLILDCLLYSKERTTDIDTSIELQNLIAEIATILKGNDEKSVTTHYVVTPSNTKKAIKLLDEYLEDLKPYGKGFVPKAHLPEALFKTPLIIGFLYGNAGQTCFSVWEKEEDLVAEERPDYRIWINKDCTDAILNFIDTNGQSANGLPIYNKRDVVAAEGYLTDGHIDFVSGKFFKIEYKKKEGVYIIKKEDNEIILDKTTAKCYLDFVRWHRENAKQ